MLTDFNMHDFKIATASFEKCITVEQPLQLR